ncbi:non-ribosomal peptide synthetase [Derxia lacustris]|uniref:non-ribosomal peptide synthetase n=1 Tax=Derxia lacustris TaxID=764842 RepID=UPI000A16E734|nr:non-ribosomal peptide synthetase [Derxia lacustris]
MTELSTPLAPEQRGLWFLHRLAPDCGAWHLVFSLAIERRETVTSPFAARLDALLDELLANYPVLRSCLEDSAAGPRQRADEAARPDLRTLDLRDAGVSDAELRERMRADARAPFDLERAPLWRVHLYRLDDSRWTLAFVVHHALLDFWSLGLLLQDIAARLGLVVPDARPDGAGWFAHAAAQSQRSHDPARQAVWLAAWKPMLDGAPVLHGLPLDRPRPLRQRWEGRSRAFALDAATSEGLRRIAREHNATPYMVLLAACHAWLHRLSGDDDIVVASPVAGRLRAEQRRMLGQFVNTLALRARIDAEAPFTALLAQLRQTVLTAMRHQDCPFSWLVEQLAPRRDPGHAPLAQLGFSWERLPLLADFADFFLAEPGPVERDFGPFALSPFPVPQQEGQLDLLLEMGGERDGAFVGTLKYDDNLFDAATIGHWLDGFRHLVAALAADPERAIADLPLCAADGAPAARAIGPLRPLPADPAAPAAADAATDTTAADPAADTLARILAVAAARPAAEAVTDCLEAPAGATRGWSYAELAARADAIAGHLIAAGVAPGSHVGLMLDRSRELVAAMLGIWRAGCAYVPLDPALPAERIADMAADAGLAHLLTESALAARVPAGIAASALDAPLATSAAARPGAGTVAYLLYTSGSTGRPKGVRIGHRALLNFLNAMRDRLPLPAGLRLLAVTTPSFDISLLELFLPLTVGATVVVCDRAALTDGALLARRLDEQRIDLLQATPASWKMLLDAGFDARPGLVALCGGEPLPGWLAEALLARCASLWNMYGPTETTIWSTVAEVRAGEPIHLGAPIDNTTLHVLDERGRPVPDGVLGELWIGGAGLALDYWQRPELTAERFTEPAGLPGAGRLYRTGDRVRWNAAGRLEHHGRLDFQIKLRGFRIELGEIEAVLRAAAGVRDAVAVVREDRAGDARLVAYVVADASEAALRAALRERLPAYMQPSALVFLDAFPQTHNRKIDRKALPAPTLDAADADHVAPRDAVEIALAAQFCRLLDLPRVGVHADFFELGGHSLLAVQLVAAIKRSLGVELPVSELIAHGSVAALAARLRALQDGTATASGHVVELQPGRGGRPLWLFHPIGGTVFCYLELSRQLGEARPIHALEAPGLAADGEAEVTIEKMAEAHLAELRARQPHGPYLLGGWCFGGVLAYEAARQLRAEGETVEGIVLIDTRAPIEANVPSDGDDATLLSWFARDLATPYGKTLHLAPEQLRELPPDTMFDAVLDAARAIDVLPPDADRARLERYFEVYIANAIALQLYFPPADDIPALLLLARDEPADYGPLLGWDRLLPTSLVAQGLPGDHNSIVHAPQAAEVARAINQHHPVAEPAALAAEAQP